MALQVNLGGILNFMIGNQPYQVAAQFEDEIGGQVFEMREGLTATGATSKIVAHTADVEIFDDGTVSSDVIKASLLGGNATYQNRNGKTVTFIGCVVIGTIKAKPADGTMAFKLGAQNRMEIVT